MKTSRKTAIIVGTLFIVGTVAGIFSVIFTGSILDGPDYLDQVAANQNQLKVGALFVLTMGLALAMVPVMMFPISEFGHILTGSGRSDESYSENRFPSGRSDVQLYVISIEHHSQMDIRLGPDWDHIALRGRLVNNVWLDNVRLACC